MSRWVNRASLMLRQAQHEASLNVSKAVPYVPIPYTRAAVSWYSFALSLFE